MYYLGHISVPVGNGKTKGRTRLACIMYSVMKLSSELYQVVRADYATCHLIEFMSLFSVRHAAR